MTSEVWLSIQYRDFYDVPRLVVVERGDELFLLDSVFDEEIDDYSDMFTVYRLPAAAKALLDHESWTVLPTIGEVVGQIAVNDVEFDASTRSLVGAASGSIGGHIREQAQKVSRS